MTLWMERGCQQKGSLADGYRGEGWGGVSHMSWKRCEDRRCAPAAARQSSTAAASCGSAAIASNLPTKRVDKHLGRPAEASGNCGLLSSLLPLNLSLSCPAPIRSPRRMHRGRVAGHSVEFVSMRAADFSVKSAQAPHPHRQALVKTVWTGSDRVGGGLVTDRGSVPTNPLILRSVPTEFA